MNRGFGGFVSAVIAIIIGGLMFALMVNDKNDQIAAREAELETIQRRDAVVAYALEEFEIVRSPSSTGDTANAAELNIMQTLRGAGLNFGAIGASEQEVANFVSAAYVRDAHKALAELKGLKANPERAKVLQVKFLRCVERSEKNLTRFVANINVVNELVARNHIGAAKAQNARVSVSSLRQQGVAVGKAPSARRPVAKKATPKPAKRSMSGRRR
ncbi:MAG: hypothetical protein UT43_C0008G0015 [Parcubacteria group bacterium GW2011_GWC1_39_29]|nr:MAG: hypothetical protein UT43_C0008G0015 [Parcubacteria group bacterium GW2011_GWC1_39_29]